ncbi:MAG: YebC/PmpR family DNA-binding transcriptional regulator [Candidatus Midichloria sp.]|uniref:YebC/PmpR family DNA-binding transcriptional regulator n=1 Tax=Hyalomma marginatum TaxID=34627 RepID=A0A8S4C1X7_9ACAR|nr:YebC/PmpR family DNA-binding transcriptional regulator [Hyalomma marginatum]CAG7599566.1 YebC/PmpR family DNA-binding transcriptional regulator [Hyalomma marginatum]
MAGHSKFRNIMHRKGAQDKKRAKVFTKILREITVAVAGGITEPQFNPRLRLAILSAKEANLTKEKVEAAIKKASSPTDSGNYEEIRYEGYGAVGIAFIVETLSDNRNRTASEVRSTFAKFGGSLGETGSVSYMFQRMGLIIYPSSVKDAEEILELAIEAGAEDCQLIGEEHEIYCSLEELHTVKDYLEAKIGEAKSAKLIWKPNITTSLDHEAIKKVLKLIYALEDLDDVQNVWTNLEIPENFEDDDN